MTQVIDRLKKAINRSLLLRHLVQKLNRRRFTGSEAYWIDRYAQGGNSGGGSYSKLAEFKAEVLNDFVKTHPITTVIEYGCGDGNQLRLAEYPHYLGFDISPQALSQCQEIFGLDKTKSFRMMKDYAGERADLTLSLDVVYHLTEDRIFTSYMHRLFASTDHFVIIYSSDKDEQEIDQSLHIRHRKFTHWVDQNIQGWKLVKHIPNRYPMDKEHPDREATGERSFADFYLYEHIEGVKPT